MFCVFHTHQSEKIVLLWTTQTILYSTVRNISLETKVYNTGWSKEEKSVKTKYLFKANPDILYILQNQMCN